MYVLSWNWLEIQRLAKFYKHKTNGILLKIKQFLLAIQLKIGAMPSVQEKTLKWLPLCICHQGVLTP